MTHRKHSFLRHGVIILVISMLFALPPASAMEIEDLVAEIILEYLFGDAWYEDGGLDAYRDNEYGWLEYPSDSEYAIYIDEQTGYLFGLYTDNTAYIAGHLDFTYSSPQQKMDMYIPATVMGVPVDGVGEGAFANIDSIGHVYIAEGVRSIGVSAFEGSSITGITLPSTLRFIEYDAFVGCQSLGNVALPEGLLFIGSSAFSQCPGITRVIIPDSVTDILFDAFSECANLESVHIGSGLNELEGNVFSLSPKLKTLTLSERNSAFYMLDGILYNRYKKSIVRYPGMNRQDVAFTVPNGITCVEDSCFADANTLKRIILPDSVTKIEDYAFYGCERCEFLDLGKNVASIGAGAILTNQMRGIWLPDSVTSLEELSLFSFTNQPYAYDSFWVLATQGNYAAAWAREQGYEVYNPTEDMLAAIGAMSQKAETLTITPEVASIGETVSLDLIAEGREGTVSLYIAGDRLVTTELKAGTAHFAFVPEQEGVFTVSALIGRETVAFCQMAVSDSPTLTVQQIPMDCQHNAAHIHKPDRMEIELQNIGQENEHVQTTRSYETWLCSRCGAYFIADVPYSMVNKRVPHDFIYTGYCACGQKTREVITEYGLALGEEPTIQWVDCTLTAPVRCWATEDCDWYTAPDTVAMGTIAFNESVTVTGFESGYAITTQPGGNQPAYVMPATLSLLPLQDPGRYGFHKELRSDGRKLNYFTTESLLYEYNNEAQLWSDYLYDKAAYDGSMLDIVGLRTEIAKEYSKLYNHNESWEVIGQIDMMFDLEAVFDFNLPISFPRIYTLAYQKMPSLNTMQAFASALKSDNHLSEVLKPYSELIERLVDVQGLVEGGSNLLSKQQKQKISLFFDDVDVLVGDSMDKLLKAGGATKKWKDIKPILTNAGKYSNNTITVMKYVLPYLKAALVIGETDVFFSSLPDYQQDILNCVIRDYPDTYIAYMASFALNSEMSNCFLEVLEAQLIKIGQEKLVEKGLEKLEEIGLEKLVWIKSAKLTEDVASLYLKLDGTADRATNQYDDTLRSYIAHELCRCGAATALSQYLNGLPARPEPNQLDELEKLVEEYDRLNQLAGDPVPSFISQIRGAINSCRMYTDAPDTPPTEPNLELYHP